MKLRYAIVVGLGLAFAGGPTLAFQEQSGAPTEQGAEEAKPATEAQAPAAGLAVPAPATAAEGTEVSIPGFGKLGVLPKMDFGLELLYGANEEKQQGPENTETPEDGDLAIKGTVKHKF
jgi:hypothetical protein